MRKRITLAMLLLVVLIVPTSLYLMVTQSFDQTVSRTEQISLREEAAIARALITEIKSNGQNPYTSALTAAQTMQQRYGSQDVSMALLYNQKPMLGASIPEEADISEFTDTQARSIYLSSKTQTLYITHRLNENVVLFIASDVSALYRDHEQQLTYAAVVCSIGLLLAVVIATLIAGGLTKPLRSLVYSANTMRDGDRTINLPKPRNDEIGTLTSAFGAMAEAVDKREQELADQAEKKQELIDALAHEMRTPLTSIVGAARLIQKKPEHTGKMSDMIVSEAMRLSTMDNDLMRLTQMNHEQPVYSCFSSKEMAEEAVEVYDDILISGDDAEFVGDRDLLIQLLRNLINNAVHSDTKKPVQVILHPDGFSVTDNGRGMTEEQIAHALEPFWKADKARTRKNGGAGLGLSLCAKIAELHQADLLLDSKPDHGTTVTLRFTTPLHPVEDSET